MNRVPRLPLAIGSIALLGCLLMVACTRWGIGISPDSATYIGMARNLLDGQGFRIWSPEGYYPVTQYAPLYSSVLAGLGYLGIEPLDGARWLNLCLFGLNITLMGGVVFRCTRSVALSCLASLYYATSEITLEIHSNAWTEPLFISLGLTGIYLLTAYLSTLNRVLLLLSAALIALAFLSRYAGLALIAVGCLGLLRMGRSISVRLVGLLAFGVLTTVPMGFWLVRNFRVAGTSTNREFSYYPFGLSSSDTIQLLIPLVFVAGILWTRARGGLREAGMDGGVPGRFLTLLLAFIVMNVVLLVASFTFADPTITITNRLFAPVYVAMAIVAICHGSALGPLLAQGARSRPWVLFLGGVLVSIHLFNTSVLVVDRYQNGFEFGGRRWVESEAMEYLKTLERDRVIYTNAGYPVAVLSGNPTVGLSGRDELEEAIPGLVRTGGVLALFAHPAGSFPGLRTVFESGDDRILMVSEENEESR